LKPQINYFSILSLEFSPLLLVFDIQKFVLKKAPLGIEVSRRAKNWNVVLLSIQD